MSTQWPQTQKSKLQVCVYFIEIRISSQCHSGQAYERKAKRKDREAGEEHARYTNLLSTLGSEMSSAKQSV